jgi:hypothetical protein
MAARISGSENRPFHAGRRERRLLLAGGGARKRADDCQHDERSTVSDGTSIVFPLWRSRERGAPSVVNSLRVPDPQLPLR